MDPRPTRGEGSVFHRKSFAPASFSPRSWKLTDAGLPAAARPSGGAGRRVRQAPARRRDADDDVLLFLLR